MPGKRHLLTLRLWPAEPGKPRPPYDGLVSVLQPMDPAELRFRADQLARVFTDRGVTYDFACGSGAVAAAVHLGVVVLTPGVSVELMEGRDLFCITVEVTRLA